MENSDDEKVDTVAAADTAVVMVDDGTLDRAEMKAQAMPYDYEAQTEYVSCLANAAKSNPELETQLRQARLSITQKWPMNEVMWMEWIAHEIGTADLKDADMAKYVVDLCRRATQDYISVDLWLTYCDTVAQCGKDDDERIRAAFEEAIASPAAYHIAEGAGIWNEYCEFERNLGNSSNVLRLYRAMFETPLAGMNNALASFEVWCNDNGVEQKEFDSIKSIYNATYDRYEKEIEHREQAITAESSEAGWIEYAKFLAGKKEKFLCVCSVYERGIKEFPQSAELWRQYIAYVERCVSEEYDRANSTDSYLTSVYTRAFRNCQDSGPIWAGYIRFIERLGNSVDTILELVVQAKNCVSSAEGYEEVLNVYIDACRRLVDPNSEQKEEGIEAFRSACKYALELLKKYRNKKVDAHIIQHWARIEYTLFGNPDEGRKLMEEAIKALSTDPFAWLSYINLERFRGREAGRCRSLYTRACNTVTTNVELIVSSWLDFESDEGTPEQWREAWTKGNKRIDEIKARNTTRERIEHEKMEAGKQKQREKQQARRKRRKERGENSPSPSPAAEDENDEGFDRAPPPRKMMKTENGSEVEGKDRGLNEKTVHVSGLAKSAKEEDVVKFFSVYGSVVAVRMGKNKDTGELAGYCFVVFSDSQSARDAVGAKRCENRELSDGDCLQVSAFKTQGVHAKEGGGAGGLEPRTLYVTNISYKADEEVVRTFFESGGCKGLKEVRVARDSATGKSRGFAYAEFETEEDANAALKMNRKLILNRPVIVMHSKQKRVPDQEQPITTNAQQPQPQVTPQITLFKPRSLRNKKI